MKPGIGLLFSGAFGFAEGTGTGLFDGTGTGTGLFDGTGTGTEEEIGTGFGLNNVGEGAGVEALGVGDGSATSM